MRRGETKGRLQFLDFLRAVAALLVVVQHFGQQLWPRFGQFTLDRLEIGQLGVTIFFLVSGFVIPFSLERSSSLRIFWTHRVFRLYPLYWASLLLALALWSVRAFPLPKMASTHLSAFILVNATMVQGAFRVPDALTVSWTLLYEMVFYVVVSGLFSLGVLRRSTPIALAAIGVSTAGWLVVRFALHGTGSVGVLFLLSSMFVGTVAYRYASGAAPARELLLVVAAVFGSRCLPFLLNALIGVGRRPAGEASFSALLTAWAAAYAIFFICFALRGKRFAAPVLYLGTISYSLYLVHPFFVDGALWRRFAPAADPWLILAGMLAGSIAFSSLTYRCIEAPGIRLGRKAAAAWWGSRPATALAPSGVRADASAG